MSVDTATACSGMPRTATACPGSPARATGAARGVRGTRRGSGTRGLWTLLVLLTVAAVSASYLVRNPVTPVTPTDDPTWTSTGKLESVRGQTFVVGSTETTVVHVYLSGPELRLSFLGTEADVTTLESFRTKRVRVTFTTSHDKNGRFVSVADEASGP